MHIQPSAAQYCDIFKENVSVSDEQCHHHSKIADTSTCLERLNVEFTYASLWYNAMDEAIGQQASTTPPLEVASSLVLNEHLSIISPTVSPALILSS